MEFNKDGSRTMMPIEYTIYTCNKIKRQKELNEETAEAILAKLN